MIATFLIIATVILVFVAFVFSRWLGGLKTPMKAKKTHAKRHKHS